MTFNLTYKPYGERSILVEWLEKIDLKILQDIISFKNKITESNLEGIVNITNAYNSILVTYANSNIDFKDQKFILKKVYTSKKMKDNLQSVLWKIPVCYNTIFASDLETISQTKKLSKQAIIKLHSQAIYTIYFIGFLPGFLYLGGLDDKLNFPRKDAPQLKIKKGINEGTKGSLKTNIANSKLLTNAKSIPTKLPKIPKNKYSKADIFNI
jgi:inhibitor of KinA